MLRGSTEQLHAVFVGRKNRSVAGKRQSDGLGKRVHGVCCEHSRTAAAAWARAVFKLGHVGIAHRGVGTFHHCRDKVGVLATPAACFHRATATEHGGDIKAHGRHQHSGSHLVAVGDTYHGIGLVGIDHVFHRVGYDVTAGKRVEHTVVAHGNAVVDGYRVELGGVAAHSLYLPAHYLAHFMQVGVTRDKLCEGVYYGYNRLAKLFALHARSHPKGTGTGHTATFGAYRTA